MSQIPHYERPEEEQEYYQDLVKLLDHYEDGWNLLIKAHKENNYDYPLPVKEEHKDNPYIPTTWLALADQVIQTIALKKYELDVFPNTIEIIRPDQMLDAYTTIGLPDTYPHWSFGKKRMIEERNFDASKHLAYEIVINSDPCLAYCMDSNSPLLQMIVIAHASYGHNTVFKNNFLLNEADASTILAENKRLRDFVLECEQTYGWKEVSDFIDFCHSMKFIDTTDEPKRPAKSPSEIARQQKEQRLAQHLYKPRQDQFNSAANENGKNPSPKQLGHPRKGEKNILAFMADHAPHMPGWKRDIMRSISRLSQYFKPQMMDKVLNEGMATFTHDRIMTTMRDIGLIDWAMYQEYKQINEGVLYQPSAVQLARDEHGRIVVDEDGNPQEQFVGAQFNPYTLGFKVLEEIERICKNPTDEDKEWFHFAGEPDWLSVVKHAVFSSSDETFIHNYLSPQAMRDLRMFKVENMDEDDYSEELQFLSQMYNVDFAQISAVQKGDGFRKMREQLAADYRIADKLPNITLWDYQEKTDRCLILRHHVTDDHLLEPKDAQMVLEYMHSQWEHPVVLESVDEDGNVLETYSSPEDYDFHRNRRLDEHYTNDLRMN